ENVAAGAEQGAAAVRLAAGVRGKEDGGDAVEAHAGIGNRRRREGADHRHRPFFERLHLGPPGARFGLRPVPLRPAEATQGVANPVEKTWHGLFLPVREPRMIVRGRYSDCCTKNCGRSSRILSAFSRESDGLLAKRIFPAMGLGLGPTRIDYPA